MCMYCYVHVAHPCDKTSVGKKNGGCDQKCTKNDVVAVCSCNEGYKLAEDKKTCIKSK